MHRRGLSLIGALRLPGVDSFSGPRDERHVPSHGPGVPPHSPPSPAHFTLKTESRAEGFLFLGSHSLGVCVCVCVCVCARAHTHTLLFHSSLGPGFFLPALWVPISVACGADKWPGIFLCLTEAWGEARPHSQRP